MSSEWDQGMQRAGSGFQFRSGNIPWYVHLVSLYSLELADIGSLEIAPKHATLFGRKVGVRG